MVGAQAAGAAAASSLTDIVGQIFDALAPIIKPALDVLRSFSAWAHNRFAFLRRKRNPKPTMVTVDEFDGKIPNDTIIVPDGAL